MKKSLVFAILVLLLSSCATTPEIDQPLPNLVFDKEEVYVLNTDALAMPAAPDFLFLVQENGNFREATDTEEPTHVAMIQEDLNKIDAMVTIKKGFEEITKEQAALINIEREKVNALKEIIALERNSRQLERTLRLDVEKSLRTERREHRIDNIVSRGTLILTIIGGVAIAAL